MKKILSVLVALSMLCSLGVMLASCAHECEFSDAWSKDATHHWHACTSEKCELVADKGEHTWDDGEITTEATQETNGVKTFACTVCGETKTEPVLFTGMTEAAWNAALANDVFENFKYNDVVTISTSGFTMDTETTYKFTATDAWVKMTMMGQSEEDYAPDTATANELRAEVLEIIETLTPYEKFKYDADTKTYKANAPIRIDDLDASTPNVTLTFADGKLVKIEYVITFMESGMQMEATSTTTLSEYGTVSFANN